MQIKIEVDGLEDIEHKLKSLQDKGANMLPVFKSIGNSVINTIEHSFESESDAFGTAWVPSKKPTGKTLTHSGALSSSFTPFATKEGVTVGTNLVYAPIHQFGGKAGRGKRVSLRARPFLPIDKDNNLPNNLKDEILDKVQDYFES